MNPPEQNTPNPFDLWSKIESDPRWGKLPEETQNQLKQFYYQRNVLGHPEIRSAIQANPNLAPQLQQKFFAPEMAKRAELDQRAAEGNVRITAQPLYRGLAQQFGLPDAQDMQPGITKGIATFAEGLTSLENIGITGATMGAGAALGAGLRGAGVAATNIPRITRTVEALTSAGFSADMLHSAYQSHGAFRQALDLAHQAELSGDAAAHQHYADLAKQYATEAVLGGGLGAVAGYHGVRGGMSAATDSPMPIERRALDKLAYPTAEIDKMSIAQAQDLIAKNERFSIAPQDAASLKSSVRQAARDVENARNRRRAQAAQSPQPTTQPVQPTQPSGPMPAVSAEEAAAQPTQSGAPPTSNARKARVTVRPTDQAPPSGQPPISQPTVDAQTGEVVTPDAGNRQPSRGTRLDNAYQALGQAQRELQSLSKAPKFAARNSRIKELTARKDAALKTIAQYETPENLGQQVQKVEGSALDLVSRMEQITQELNTPPANADEWATKAARINKLMGREDTAQLANIDKKTGVPKNWETAVRQITGMTQGSLMPRVSSLMDLAKQMKATKAELKSTPLGDQLATRLENLRKGQVAPKQAAVQGEVPVQTQQKTAVAQPGQVAQPVAAPPKPAAPSPSQVTPKYTATDLPQLEFDDKGRAAAAAEVVFGKGNFVVKSKTSLSGKTTYSVVPSKAAGPMPTARPTFDQRMQAVKAGATPEQAETVAGPKPKLTPQAMAQRLITRFTGGKGVKDLKPETRELIENTLGIKLRGRAHGAIVQDLKAFLANEPKPTRAKARRFTGEVTTYEDLTRNDVPPSPEASRFKPKPSPAGPTPAQPAASPVAAQAAGKPVSPAARTEVAFKDIVRAYNRLREGEKVPDDLKAQIKAKTGAKTVNELGTWVRNNIPSDLLDVTAKEPAPAPEATPMPGKFLGTLQSITAAEKRASKTEMAQQQALEEGRAVRAKNPTPKGVPEMVWDTVQSKLDELNYKGERRDLAEAAIAKWVRKESGDPMMFKNLKDRLGKMKQASLPAFRGKEEERLANEIAEIDRKLEEGPRPGFKWIEPVAQKLKRDRAGLEAQLDMNLEDPNHPMNFEGEQPLSDKRMEAQGFDNRQIPRTDYELAAQKEHISDAEAALQELRDAGYDKDLPEDREAIAREGLRRLEANEPLPHINDVKSLHQFPAEFSDILPEEAGKVWNTNELAKRMFGPETESILGLQQYLDKDWLRITKGGEKSGLKFSPQAQEWIKENWTDHGEFDATGENVPMAGEDYDRKVQEFTEAARNEVSPLSEEEKTFFNRLMGGESSQLPGFAARREKAEALMAKKAEAEIRQHPDVEWLDAKMGLAWFHDPVTGSTLAMHLGDAVDPRKVREHIELSRAKFNKALTLPEKLAMAPEGIALAVRHLPEPIQKMLFMSPERGIRTVAREIPQDLQQAMLRTGTDLKATTLQHSSDFSLGEYNVDFDGNRAITLRAMGNMERAFRSIIGDLSMREAAAHEFGHRVFDMLRGNVHENSMKRALMQMYPEAVRDIMKRYQGRPISGQGDVGEMFAHSFMHWYEGKDGDPEGFSNLLTRFLPKDQHSLLDLRGGGLRAEPGSGIRLSEIAFAHMTGDPTGGLPMSQPLANLIDAFKRSSISNEPTAEKTRSLGREILVGDLRWKKAKLYNDLAEHIDRWKNASTADFRLFTVAMETGNVNLLQDPRDRAIAGTLRQLLDERRDAINNLDPTKFQHYLENYFPHIWKDPRRGAAFIQQVLGSKRPIGGPSTFLRHRTIDSIADGLDAGLEPITTNPVDMALIRLHEMDRYLAGHQFKAELRTEGLVQFFRPGQKRTIPDGWMRLDDPIFQPMTMNANRELVKRGEYYAPPEVAKIVNNYLSPGLRGKWWFDALRKYGNTLNMMQLNFSAFHAGFEALDAASSDVALGLEKVINGREIKAGAANVLRGITPLASVIHAYRVGRMMESEYLEPGSHPHLTNMVEQFKHAGGTIGLDPFYDNMAVDQWKKAWSDGKPVSVALRTIPAFAEFTSRWLMKYMVPRVKMGVFYEMAKYKLADLSQRGISDRFEIANEMDKAWDSVENRLGQMTYDNLFVNRTMKDLGFLMVRSLGWNLGTLREIGGGMMDVGKQFARSRADRELTHRTAYILGMTGLVGLYGALYNRIASGTDPEQIEDYVFPRTGKMNVSGKPERVSLPSYLRDVVATTNHPLQTAVHKLHPMWGQLFEMYQNQDYYGVEIRHQDDPVIQQALQVAGYLGKQFVPLGAQNAYERARSVGETGLTAPFKGEALGSTAQSFFGITPAPKYVGQSAAEQLAFDLARSHMEQGPRTSDVFQHQQMRSMLRNRMAQGKMDSAHMSEMLNSGKITTEDISTAAEEIGTPPLERYFSRLTLPEAMRVMRKASPEEKQMLTPIFLDKLGNIDALLPEERGAVLRDLHSVLQ